MKDISNNPQPLEPMPQNGNALPPDMNCEVNLLDDFFATLEASEDPLHKDLPSPCPFNPQTT